MGKVQNTDAENVEITPELFEQSFYEYLDNCDQKEIAPSLPHFLTFVNRRFRTRYTEKDIAETLTYGKEGTNKKWKQVLSCILLGFRGEYLSNPKWGNHQSSKAQLVLSKDYGDGIRYSQKENNDNSIDSLQVTFGNGDDRGIDAAK